MKARIPKPKQHIMVTRFEEKYHQWRYGTRFDLYGNYPVDKIDAFVEKTTDILQSIVNVTINSWWTKLPSGTKIRVEYHDIWSADVTISTLVVPILIKLKNDTHGGPILIDDDKIFPDHLKLSDSESAESLPEINCQKHIDRWYYILDEMIYAFTRIRDDDVDVQFMTKVVGDDGKDKYNELGFEKFDFDKEGYDAEMARIQNGLNLFSKYFTALWD